LKNRTSLLLEPGSFRPVVGQTGGIVSRSIVVSRL
jgi:hypothetical protein